MIVTEVAFVVTKSHDGVSDFTEQDKKAICRQLMDKARYPIIGISFPVEQVRKARSCGAIDMAQAQVCRVIFKGRPLKFVVARFFNRLRVPDVFFDLISFQRGISTAI